MWDNMQDSGSLDSDFDADKWSVDQKQLVALARAVLMKSPISILDEATSSVDHETETETLMHDIIKKKNEFKHRTVFGPWRTGSCSWKWYDRIVVVRRQRTVRGGEPRGWSESE
ncbi:hypothetical protein K504DRAFT_523775, partial [Pleomassaria siparia CBS 279.74]